MQVPSTGKRLAKNTFYMYLRMFIQLLIALYTSRVVLQQLGVADYGIYNLAGSVVAMFSSLRGLFASSTQRFLNFEMGRMEEVGCESSKKNYELNRIFNMSINVNALMSILFIIFVELVGIWFFNNKVNVDPSRLAATQFVFQFSLATAVINILATPFDAEIIAHEKMDFYAIIAIIEGALKLGVAFMLPLFSADKLIMYGALVFVVYLSLFLFNIFYCHTHFEECRIKLVWDKQLFAQLFSFAGWNFLGNTAYTLAHNGINMVLNVFGGPVVNAARGIAYQVQSAVNRFLTNISVVIRPYSIKQYAKGDYHKYNDIICLSAKVMFTIQLCLVIIINTNVDVLLNLWLKEVPTYATVFTQIILIDTLIRSLAPSIDISFMAEGKMKKYQITESVILSLPLLASFILLKIGTPYYFCFVSICIFEIINLLVTLIIAGKETHLDIKQYFRGVILPCFVCFASFIIFSILAVGIDSNEMRLVLTVGILIIMLLYMYLCGFTKLEKQALLSVVKKNK